MARRLLLQAHYYCDALMTNAHQKLYAIADDLDQRAAALQRHARDLRQQAQMLEAKIRNAVEFSDRPDRRAAGWHDRRCTRTRAGLPLTPTRGREMK
jgi:hypothetical protein